MKTIDLAIIIPTLNEEYYIGLLLDSIKQQTLQPTEVLVIDAYSQDNTIKEIKKRQKSLPQLKYYQIRKYTISRQRNLGAKKTKASHILFLDADMQLRNEHIIEQYWQKIKKFKPDIATADNWPDTNYWKDILYFWGENSLLRSIKPFWPSATSRNMYVNKKAFLEIGGFDEEVAVGEDMEFIQRVVKNGLIFKIFSNPRVYTSSRRLQKDGHRRHLLKMVKSFLYVQKNGFKDNPIEYEFGNFGPKK